MKIGVDCRPLLRRQLSGIPVYVKELLSSIARIGSRHEFVLYAPSYFDFPLPTPNWSKRYGSLIQNGTLWMQFELPSMIKKDNLDLYWGTQNLLPLALNSKIKTVLTVHDVMYRIYPELMAPYNRLIQNVFFPWSLKKGDAFVAISQSTMNDVERLFHINGKRKLVIPNGASPFFKPQDKESSKRDVKQWYNIQPPYILAAGTFEPRKNLSRIIQAFTRVASQIPHHLVVVGPNGWKNGHLKEEVDKSHLRERIHLIGYIENDQLLSVYSGADVFVFASLYEGFGLPPLEVMACGVPVICSNTSSMPEVVGDAARLFDPYSVDEITKALLEVATDEKLKASMAQKSLEQAKKFSWDISARKLLALFDQIEQENSV